MDNITTLGQSQSEPQIGLSLSADDQLTHILSLCLNYLSVRDLFSLLCSCKKFQILKVFVVELKVIGASNLDAPETNTANITRTFVNLRTLEISHVHNVKTIEKFVSKLSLKSLKLFDSCIGNAPYTRQMLNTLETGPTSNFTLENLTIVNSELNTYELIPRFGSRLRVLVLDRCMFVHLAALTKALGYVDGLEKLSLQRCFTDRKALKIERSSLLKAIEIVECPNITGILLNDCKSLRSIHISNCPIANETIHGLLDKADSLEYITINNCNQIRRELIIENARARSIDLNCNFNILTLVIKCDLLRHLSVAKCHSLEHISIQSNYLRTLDLAMLNQLTDFDLLCPQLETLDITGCAMLCKASLPIGVATEEVGLPPLSILSVNSEDDTDDDQVPESTRISLNRRKFTIHANENSFNRMVLLLTRLRLHCKKLDLIKFLSFNIYGTELFESRSQLETYCRDKLLML